MGTYAKGFKFRIYPNKEQQNRIQRILGCCRFVYNHFLALRRDEWTENKTSVTYNQTSAETRPLLSDAVPHVYHGRKGQETRAFPGGEGSASKTIYQGTLGIRGGFVERGKRGHPHAGRAPSYRGNEKAQPQRGELGETWIQCKGDGANGRATAGTPIRERLRECT